MNNLYNELQEKLDKIALKCLNKDIIKVFNGFLGLDGSLGIMQDLRNITDSQDFGLENLDEDQITIWKRLTSDRILQLLILFFGQFDDYYSKKDNQEEKYPGLHEAFDKLRQLKNENANALIYKTNKINIQILVKSILNCIENLCLKTLPELETTIK